MMAKRVFCEPCGQLGRCEVATHTSDGVPMCAFCHTLWLQDAGNESGVAIEQQGTPIPLAAPQPEVAAPPVTPSTPQTLLQPAKVRCVDCGAKLRFHRKRPQPRLQCRDCEKKAITAVKRHVGMFQPETLEKEHEQVSPRVPLTIGAGRELREYLHPKKAAEMALTVEDVRKAQKIISNSLNPGFEPLSDEAYAKLKPACDEEELFGRLLVAIGGYNHKQCRMLLECKKKGGTKNLSDRLRRYLRKNGVTANIEAFPTARCVVVSVGYGKAGR